jgi:hypothetical protein
MVAKISVSLPDDVAAYLSTQANASATIAAALRAQMAAAHLDEVLARAGISVTDAGKARWRGRLAEPIPPTALADGQRLLDDVA